MKILATGSVRQYPKRDLGKSNNANVSFMALKMSSQDVPNALRRIVDKNPSLEAEIANTLEEARQRASGNTICDVILIYDKNKPGKRGFLTYLRSGKCDLITSDLLVYSPDVPANHQFGINNFRKNLLAQVEKAQEKVNESALKVRNNPAFTNLEKALSNFI